MKKLMKALFGAWCVVLCAGAAFAERLSSDPQLVPDYNRDGKIDPLDYEREAAGEPFIIWLNDDDDADGIGDGNGDTNTDLHDVPGGEGNDKDCEDYEVNGRCRDYKSLILRTGRP